MSPPKSNANSETAPSGSMNQRVSISKSETPLEIRGVLKEFLTAYPGFLQSTAPFFPKNSVGKLFLESLPMILKEYDTILDALGMTFDGNNKSSVDLTGIPKLASHLGKAIQGFLPQLKGSEFDQERSATMRILGSMEKFSEILAQTEKRGFPADSPEGGVHAHAVNRKEGRTRTDGPHLHILKIGDFFFMSREGGPHWHGIRPGARRSEGGDSSKHDHIWDLPAGLILPSGRVLERDMEVVSKIDAPHDHDLLVSVTGFDGTHDHEVELPDGTMTKTISVAEFVAMHPPEDPPFVAPASELLKIFHNPKDRKNPKKKSEDDCPECETAIAKYLDVIDADFAKAWNTADGMTFKSLTQKQTTVQSLVLSKERFKTLTQARQWVKDNGGVSDKVDETTNTFRFRQFNPGRCKEGTFRNKRIADGVIGVICVPKGAETPEGLQRSTKDGGEDSNIFGIITEKSTVKGTEDVYNYTVGIGPIPSDDVKKFANIVEIGGKSYTNISQTVSTKVDHKPGDVIEVTCTKIMVDYSEGKTSIRWTRPELFEDGNVISREPTTIEGLAKVAELGDIHEAYRDILTKRIPLMKTAEERFVLGIVLEPETRDSQGEIYSIETVRKTAHGFMEFFGNSGFMHREIITGKVKILETFLAPADFVIDSQKVKKGTWLMGHRIIADDLWEGVKDGSITGYSIGGSAVRVEEGMIT